MIRVKICGITNLEDALFAIETGADAIGFVFYSKSPRYIEPNLANEIVNQLPPFITPVALFVNASASEVDAVVSGNSRWVVQFHGDESPKECDSYGVSYIKALRMKPELDLRVEFDRYIGASAILLDAYKPGVPGGTGEVFDWGRIPKSSNNPIILAGGLTPSNISQAVSSVSPYAVDVSGGVELAKGKKDFVKVRDFIFEAKGWSKK
ncbi:phosphoribosylanthranilate isomerase [Marinomonas mediterranea]|jgi:phosphoribosylanthranilate isomerase (EC 5.3.1.24)|uniref:N-(5'-phosphoribosyl)anthranilate isomerase n=1 Tax=Marinomonas mediterranea (strain ATCC 700492 / JCM 21426 / NBRC 103028 / MMB-1) TaxID=717774 RepID=F2K3X8_MARM1|nr:phosphoribosylanthranilate isomerase [Marinomonas mediterranea]ADZ91320.1 Phosphoribosylanthranilate isomerase [Marinomonas mediterranea MMB-1]WCN09291.1 phosphoribosylanthranilate isomerase [Marinomonas mediterranea]WCN13373.1 phosphoribosylanthranilate isomerase [Marinomonas mediterranea]WCN17441.1 phosphoribosylanthranilate isomerase [Marinomonas mediterranea MMB-1]